jgi:hypothetical protein
MAVLASLARDGGALLRKTGGNLDMALSILGYPYRGETLDPHALVQALEGKGYLRERELMLMASQGVPVRVAPRPVGSGSVREEMLRGNYPMSAGEWAVVVEKVFSEAIAGRVLVLEALDALELLGERMRVSPVFVLEEKSGKFRVINDLAAEGRTRGSSVNALTDLATVPPSSCGGVREDILRKVWGWRQKCPDARIVLSKMDVSTAFRQVCVSVQEDLLAFMLGVLVVIDLRLPFGWNASPGWWGVCGDAIRFLHNDPNFVPAPEIAEAAAKILEAAHISVVPALQGERPALCTMDPIAAALAEGGGRCDPFSSDIYVDDLILAALAEEGQCLRSSKAAVEAHLTILGAPKDGAKPVVGKFKDWDVKQEVLGLVVDTVEMTVALPERKLEAVRQLLAEWGPDRLEATVHQLAQVIGNLYWAARAVVCGRYFIHRLIWLTVGFGYQKTNQQRRVKIGPEAHMDLAWWRWALGVGRLGPGAPLAAPIALAMESRLSTDVWHTDASVKALGGCCLRTGAYWRYDLTEEERTRVIIGRVRVKVAGEMEHLIHINLLELLALVYNTRVMTRFEGQVPSRNGDAVDLMGDNKISIAWLCNAGGARGRREAALIRLLEVIELESGWAFRPAYIPGAKNTWADAITRIPLHLLQAHLEREMPGVPWRKVELGQQENELLSTLLRPAWKSDPWPIAR